MNVESLLAIIKLSSMILSVSVGVIAFLSLLFFFFQGWKKALVRAVKNIVCALLALILANPIADAIARPVISFVQPLLRSSIGDALYEDLFVNGGHLGGMIEAVPSALIAPFVFVGIYLFLSFVLMFFVPLFTRLIFERGGKGKELDKKARMHSRLLGLPSGVVNAILVTAIVFLPVAGYFKTAANAFDTMVDNGLEVSFDQFGIENSEDAVEVVDAVSDNIIIRLSYGSGLIFNNLTNFRINDTKYLLTEEFGSVLSIVSEALKLNVDISTYGEPQVEAIENIVRIFDASDLMKNVSADVVSRLAGAWKDGNKYLGIPKPELGAKMQPVAESVFAVMATTTYDTITPDVTTIGNVGVIFIDYGAIGIINDSIGITDLVNKEGFVSALLEEIYSNVRMASVATEIQNYAIVMVAEVLGVPADSEEVLSNMLDDIAKSVNDLNLSATEMTPEELTTVLEDSLNNDFTLNGVEIPDDVIPLLSEYLVEECTGRGELTGDDIFEMFTDITDAYGAYVGASTAQAEANTGAPKLEFIGHVQATASKGELSPVEKLIVKIFESDLNIKKSDIDKFFRVTTSIKDRELETNAITLETIKEMAGGELTAEELTNEAKIIEDIARKGYEFANNILESQKNGENVLMSVDPTQLQEIFTLAKSSNIIGDKADDFLRAVVESKTLKDTGMIDAGTFDALLDGGTDEIGNKLETIQNTLGIMDSLNKEETGNENINESIEWLIENMSQSSAKVLKSQLTQKKLLDYGIPAKSANPVSDFLHNMLDRMSSSNGLTEDEYKNEADAIRHIFDVAKKFAEKQSHENVFGYTIADANDIANTVLGSEVMGGALVDSIIDGKKVKYDYFNTGVKLGDADTENLISAINNYTAQNYAAAADKTVENNKITALAAIFNVQITISASGVVSAN